MADLMYFLRLARRQAGWMAVGLAAALFVMGAGIALLGLAGGMVAGGMMAGVVVAGAAVLLRALAVGRAIARYLERLLTHEATFRVLADLRLWFFKQTAPLSPGRLDGLRASDLLSRLVGDIDALDGLYLRLITPGVVAIAAAMILAVVLGGVSMVMAVLVLGLFALAGIGVPAVAERAGRDVGAEQVVAVARLRTATVDYVQGITDLLVNQAEARQAARIQAAGHQRDTAGHRQAIIAAWSAAATQVTTHLALIAVILTGAWAVHTGRAGLGGVVLALFVTLAAFEAVAPLPGAWQTLGRIKTAARRLLEVATTEPAVSDPPPDRRVPVPSETTLRFEGVTFQYPGSETAALRGIDLTIAEGERVAITGPSGAGKSTLLSLIVRFHDPDAGRVTLDGVDLRDLAQVELLSRIGVLSQATAIFAGTLRQNLLLGRAEADEETLRAALATAGLDSFVGSLPDGLDTWLGEAGVAVSGGEARRIALARVLLKDAPILLLDEPTEGLDADTEAEVIQALGAFIEGRTVLLISHRPAPLALADRVLRIEDGRLQQPG
ncbi:MAG: thiol reductant ABC exporter subunit CydC [Alphaproteobacteria bacterium]|nr:thiol reductant ABC exporter subunit CydC [Alphaproteobacteria bacterium]